MGLETINDPILRKNWEKFINLADDRFKKENINLNFNTFKNDGSYSKAKAMLPGVYFAFAQDSRRTWVELELKARTSKGKRYSQDELYTFLKENFRNNGYKTNNKITWNEEDLANSPRNPNGLDKRIKIYLHKPTNEEWIQAMIDLSNIFMQYLI
ncbi:MAG: hypothetical protein RBR08_06895 [Desulforegulaceae bacterium]|jgi:hypothetical protein|nr:hypothetical protein [Desulforegulaceae bacterium]